MARLGQPQGRPKRDAGASNLLPPHTWTTSAPSRRTNLRATGAAPARRTPIPSASSSTSITSGDAGRRFGIPRRGGEQPARTGVSSTLYSLRRETADDSAQVTDAHCGGLLWSKPGATGCRPNRGLGGPDSCGRGTALLRHEDTTGTSPSGPAHMPAVLGHPQAAAARSGNFEGRRCGGISASGPLGRLAPEPRPPAWEAARRPRPIESVPLAVTRAAASARSSGLAPDHAHDRRTTAVGPSCSTR